jgi:hypothetical protein
MKVAGHFANVYRNGDSDDRRLKSRFGNADRSSGSLLFKTGFAAENFLAVPPPGMLRFSIDRVSTRNQEAIYSNFCF